MQHAPKRPRFGGEGGWIYGFWHSQCVPQDVPNSITLWCHIICPKLFSCHIYRWAKAKELYIENCKVFFFCDGQSKWLIVKEKGWILGRQPHLINSKMNKLTRNKCSDFYYASWRFFFSENEFLTENFVILETFVIFKVKIIKLVTSRPRQVDLFHEFEKKTLVLTIPLA